MRNLRFIVLVIIAIITQIDTQKSLTKLTYEENEERLKKCGKEYSIPNAVCKTDCWVGRLVFKDRKGVPTLDKSFGAVLISPRHALVSHSILSFTQKKNQVKFDGEKAGVNCRNTNPTLSTKSVDWEIAFFLKNKEELADRVGIKDIAYYGRCKTSDKKPSYKNDGIMIIEFNKTLDVPYACVPDDKFYSKIENQPAYLPWTLGNKNVVWYNPNPGKVTKCESRKVKDGKLCWKQNGDLNIKDWKNDEISLPIMMTEKKTTTLVGLGHTYNTATKSFVFTDLEDFTKGLCDYIGVCAPGILKPPTTTTKVTSTTTTVPTTTSTTVPTTTTTPESPYQPVTADQATTSTTTQPMVIEWTRNATNTPAPFRNTTVHAHYVPALLFDEEMQDFEIPYHRKKRVKKGGMMCKSWKMVTVVLMMISILVPAL